MSIEKLKKQQKIIVESIKFILNEKKPKPHHKERVLNMAEVAKEVGISRRCLYLFIKSSNPTFHTVFLLASYFDIDINPK
ncbi:MAG: hypothetical protein BWY19_00770 [bacterium ADurb.Bin212]|nr:MAG: hypothetical protein BWY19_00770 [bacterium ADurb.Bin212]